MADPIGTACIQGEAQGKAPSCEPVQPYLERYSEHARRLQTWIGGFGAGLASVLLYQFRTYSETLDESKLPAARENLGSALTLIAIAIAIQVSLLLLNKFTQFILANPPAERKHRSYTRAEWLSERWEVDFVGDVLSVASLTWATVCGLTAIGIT